MSDTLDGSDLQNQNIQIGDTTNNSNDNRVSNDPKIKSSQIQNIENQIGEKVVQSATETFTKSWIEKYLCCLDFLKKYFQITSDDFFKRFLESLVPYNNKFQETIEKNPDLYGPFWIYTTLILVIASCGSLTIFFERKSNSTKENFFQKFIPIAASVIYIIGFGLPILLTFLMKLFGSNVNFVNIICTYGYSFSVYIIAVISCITTLQVLQWIFLAYACFSSTWLLVVGYWKELEKYPNNKKYIICGIVLIFQVGLFLLIKMYFFSKFEDSTDDK